MATKIIKQSFNAGELSPLLDGRTDLGKYYNGCSIMSNVFPLPSGGFIVRSGSEFIAKGKGACRIVPFEFSAADIMLIEMGNTYARFYKDDDRVMTDSVNIAAITLPSGSEVSVQANSHGFSTGDIVRFTSVGGTTELNYTGINTEWTITKTGANTFTLDGTDGDDFTAYTSGGTVAAIYEITTPYSASEVFEISMARIGDVIRIDHDDYEPRKLTRVSDNSWTIAAITFNDGPFLDENTTTTYLMETNKVHAGTHTGGNNQATLTDSSKSWDTDVWVGKTIYNVTDGSSGTITANTANTVTATLSGGAEDDWDINDEYYIEYKNYIASGTTGITLTASGSGNTPFNANHVGAKFLLLHKRADNHTQTALDEIRIKGDFSLHASNFTAGSDEVRLSRKEGEADWQLIRAFSSAVDYSSTEYEDDVKYRFNVTDGDSSLILRLTAKNQVWRSIVEVTAYTSTSLVTVTALTDIYFDYDDSDNQTYEWAEGAWSDYRGWPRAVALHDGRCYHGGTTYSPTTLWGSRTGKYDDMTPGDLDSDAMTHAISDDDASQIEWMKSRSGLLVGTSKKEYLISAADINDPVTASDVRSRVQSENGSDHLQPVSLNDSLFYVQRQGRRILMARLNDYGDRFVSVDATILAEHLMEYSPDDLDVQRTPTPILYVVRSDGTLCCFVYMPEEDVAAWCRLVTGSLLDQATDAYKSVAVVRGSIEDDVWCVVSRTIDGSTVYYIEKFSTRYIDQLDEAMMLDAAVVEDGTYDSQDITLASDTVRYGSGIYGSSYYGGTY